MKHNVRHSRHRLTAYWLFSVGCVLALAAVVTVVSYLPRQAVHAASSDWTTYLGSNARTSYNAAETTINTTTAPNLKIHWAYSTVKHAQITAEVMAANGMLYWGDWNGGLHASDPATGKDIWTTTLATRPGGCSHRPKGVISSVTVATVPLIIPNVFTSLKASL